MPPADFDATYRQVIAKLREDTGAGITIISSTSSVYEITLPMAQKLLESRGAASLFGKPEVLESFNAIAKTVAGETAVQVLDLAMRIGGGSAFRKDLPIERLFRDTRASVVMAPTVDASNEFVARLLLGMPLFDGGEQ